MTNGHFSRLAITILAAGLLAGCGARISSNASGSPTATPSPTATASPTPDPAVVGALTAVGEKAIPFFPYYTYGPGCPCRNVYSDCAAPSGFSNFDACPITPRLRSYFQTHPYGLCRGCATGSPTRSISVTVTPTGGIVHVGVYNDREKLDLIVVKLNGQYLVDDEVCTGAGPETSIYTSPGPPPSAWGCGNPS